MIEWQLFHVEQRNSMRLFQLESDVPRETSCIFACALLVSASWGILGANYRCR
jgi:hypothetical protein